MSYKFHAPNVSEADRDAIATPVDGMLIYNTDRDRFEFYEPFWGWHPVALTPSAMRDWGVEFIEDFTLTAPASVWSFTSANSGTVSFLDGYFGVVRLSTSTTNNARSQFRTSLQPIQFGGGAYRWDSRVRILVDSSVAETFQFIVGFWDNATGVDNTDGIYFLYDEQGVSTGSAASGNWQCVTTNNSTRTFTDSGVAIDNTNLQKLRIDVNAAGTEAKFYIDNTLVSTHNTNVPTGSARTAGSGVYLQKSNGTTARTAEIDYLYLKAKFTTPR